MPAPGGGKQWTDKETDTVRYAWLMACALGRDRAAAVRQVAARLGRTPASVKAKLESMGLSGRRPD